MTASLDRSSFLFGSNAGYIADLYARFLANPGSVDASWTDFFRALDEDNLAVLDELRGASWAPRDLDATHPPVADPLQDGAAALAGPGNGGMIAHAQSAFGGVSQEQLRRATLDSLRALMLIRVYRVRGHM
ncbi:2-oxoglutarate dehydrogenase E1 component, partial [bacterium]|nr:2-oxoglutarate dehydrogenase E1 component [bacterium]